jgi:hypothetical protein
LRQNWWLFRRSNEQLRAALAGLPRYIATVETTKHRVFQFLDASIKPEHRLVVTGSDDAFLLGVLSSRFHVVYALAAGGTLEDRPVYNKSRCFDTFPFPEANARQREKIAALAERLDQHRKQVHAKHGLGLTAIYNVLAVVREASRPLNAKEKRIYDDAQIIVLRHHHDELDVAVAAAYGWPVTISEDDILARLSALNAARAAEESRGKIRWLRPEFQAPTQDALSLAPGKKAAKPKSQPAAAAPKSRAKPVWPQERPAQVEAVAAALRAAAGPVTAADLAANFSRGKKEPVAEILAALVVLGRAHKGEKRGTFTVLTV